MASGSTQVKYLGIYQKIKQQILDGEYKINEKFRVAPSLLKDSMFQHLRLKSAGSISKRRLHYPSARKWNSGTRLASAGKGTNDSNFNRYESCLR